jgi:hypothetical protein
MFVEALVTNALTAIGYAVYFNVFYKQFEHHAKSMMVPVLIKYKIVNPHLIEDVIFLTSQSLLDRIQTLLIGYPGAYEAVVIIGREAYAESYKYVYYVSIGMCLIFWD